MIVCVFGVSYLYVLVVMLVSEGVNIEKILCLFEGLFGLVEIYVFLLVDCDCEVLKWLLLVVVIRFGFDVLL